MIYRAIGVLFSHAGLSVAFAEFHENAGNWLFETKAHKTYSSGDIDSLLREFIEENNLQYKVALITIHSDVGNEIPAGASIAAITGLPVITDLPALDLALGGNGRFYETTSQKLGIKDHLNELNKTLCVAFMGILRWREEYNFLSSITGASRSSIGGAVWLGQDA